MWTASGRAVARAAVLGLGIIGAAAAGAALLRTGAESIGPAVAAAGVGGGQAVFGELTGSAAALGTGVLLLWLALGAAVHTMDVLRTRRGRFGGRLAAVAERVTPAVTRRLVATVLGAGIACGTAPPASALAVDPGWRPAPAATAPAATAPADPAPAPSTPADGRPDTAPDATPGWQPAPPAEPPRETDADLGPLATAQRERATSDEEVVVRRGDTLWDIAARHLPAGAGDIQIALEWPRWYAANAGVIGDDPDLIVPGMRLVPPSPGSGIMP